MAYNTKGEEVIVEELEHCKHIPSWFAGMHLVYVMSCLLSLVVYRGLVWHWIDEMDRDNVEPSDYTVWFKKLGPELEKQEVKEWLQFNGRKDGKFAKVEKVNLLYDISERIEWSRMYKKFKERKEQVEDFMAENNG